MLDAVACDAEVGVHTECARGDEPVEEEVVVVVGGVRGEDRLALRTESLTPWPLTNWKGVWEAVRVQAWWPR